MFPALTCNDESDHRAMNIMKQSQFSVGQSSGESAPYRPDATRIELLPVNHRPTAPAALVNTVTHVVFLRSYEQMLWLNARRVVAAVQNLLAPSKDNPVMQFVRKAVGQLLELARSRKDSVSLIIGSGSPNPAPLLLVNSFPEQLLFRLNQRGGIASTATEFRTTPFYLIGFSKKAGAARITNASDLGSSQRVSASVATGCFLTFSKRALTVLTSAWYFLGWTWRDLRTGCKVSRPIQSLQRLCGPLCILAQGR